MYWYRSLYVLAGARGRRPVRLPDPQPSELAGPNPMPAPREIRVYTVAELNAIAEELGTLTPPRCGSRQPGLGPLNGRLWSGKTSTRPAGCSSYAGLRRSARDVSCRSLRRRSTRSSRCRLGSTAATCSRLLGSAGPWRAGAVRHRELPPPRVGAGDRRGRDRETGEALRPPVDVRLERARGRDHDVRDSPGSWAPRRR